MKRMRAAGKIPAVLYGHGEDTVVLSVSAKDVGNAIRNNTIIVELTGDLTENAMIKDIQWDPIGTDEVLHMDFARVDMNELVEVTVQLEFRGEAPGTKVGGTVLHPERELTILCPVSKIPDHLEVLVNELELDQTIHASEIELPDGASLVTQGETPVAQCQVIAEEVEEVAEPAEGEDGGSPAEPEVIGEKKDDDDSDS